MSDGAQKIIMDLVAIALVVVCFIQSVVGSCDLMTLQPCACSYHSARRYEMDCQNSGLSQLPDNVNYTVAEGYAVGNFSYNQIGNIPDHYFKVSRHYDNLDFSHNRIKKLGPNTFSGLLSVLHTLNISDNAISVVPVETFKGYSRLEDLDLSGNDIKSPCQIEIPYVERLSLARNGIKNLDDNCFQKAFKVTNMDLSENTISHIQPQTFAGMTLLKELNLDYNKLADVDTGFEALVTITAFESLSMRGNGMRFLNSLCGYTWPNIRHLDFGHNSLEDIRQYCFKPYHNTNPSDGPNPLYLSFEHNVLTVITSSAFKGLESRLAHLRLNNNRIRVIDISSFRGMSKLAELYLQSNELDSLEVLRGWEGNVLRELDVSFNLITSLSPGVFTSMRQLVKVSLNANRLLALQPAAFTGMTSLLDLSLNYNYLANMADSAFSGIEQLERLRLSGNSLVTLKNCTFAPLTKLVEFHFDDNMLHCDCDLLWLLEFWADINQRGVADASVSKPIDEDQCYYPLSLRGEAMANEVSAMCTVQEKTSCFGVTAVVASAGSKKGNLTWSWASQAVSARSLRYTQLDVEADRLVADEELQTADTMIELKELNPDLVYKVNTSMTPV